MNHSTQSILASAQEGRFIIEDFTPLAESLEWTLGQLFWFSLNWKRLGRASGLRTMLLPDATL